MDNMGSLPPTKPLFGLLMLDPSQRGETTITDVDRKRFFLQSGVQGPLVIGLHRIERAVSHRHDHEPSRLCAQALSEYGALPFPTTKLLRGHPPKSGEKDGNGPIKSMPQMSKISQTWMEFFEASHQVVKFFLDVCATSHQFLTNSRGHLIDGGPEETGVKDLFGYERIFSEVLGSFSINNFEVNSWRKEPIEQSRLMWHSFCKEILKADGPRCTSYCS
ncbi:hypothetical protein Tco_1201273 [Tanacetum coccineum]